MTKLTFEEKQEFIDRFIHKPTWTSKETALVLGVHPKALVRSLKNSNFPHFKTPTGHYRFLSSDVLAYINANKDV